MQARSLARPPAAAPVLLLLTEWHSTNGQTPIQGLTTDLQCPLTPHDPQAAAQGNAHAMELLAGALALDIRLHAQVGVSNELRAAFHHM